MGGVKGWWGAAGKKTRTQPPQRHWGSLVLFEYNNFQVAFHQSCANRQLVMNKTQDHLNAHMMLQWSWVGVSLVLGSSSRRPSSIFKVGAIMRAFSSPTITAYRMTEVNQVTTRFVSLPRCPPPPPPTVQQRGCQFVFLLSIQLSFCLCLFKLLLLSCN